jgi:hypothetical protein
MTGVFFKKTVILGLQQPSGVFAGDVFGETDTRFLYCAVSALSLLGALDCLDRERTVSYLVSCRNFDGGFGRIAGSESHAAQGMSLSLSHSPHTRCALAPLLKRRVSDMCFLPFIIIIIFLFLAVWVCTAALAILDRLDVVDLPTLGWWLAERQLPNGGMNGRPEKLEAAGSDLGGGKGVASARRCSSWSPSGWPSLAGGHGGGGLTYLSVAVTTHRALIITSPFPFQTEFYRPAIVIGSYPLWLS